MTAEEFREQLLLYAAGQLDPADEALLRAKLAHASPEELGALAEAEALTAELAMTSPDVVPSNAARANLVARIQGSISSSNLVSGKHATPHATFHTKWKFVALLAACIALIAGSFAFLVDQQRKADAQHAAEVLAKVDAHARELESTNVEFAKSAEVVRSQNLKLVSLTGQNSSAAANVFWDRTNSRWTVSVFQLKPLSSDEVYELWFINKAGKPIAAGDLLVDANGEGVTTVLVPANIELAAAGITTERRGVPHDAPTPPIHLSGAVQ